MYISARCIGIAVFTFSSLWIILAIPVEVTLDNLSNSNGCDIVHSFEVQRITSTCVWIFSGQVGYGLVALVLFFICILIGRGDLMCDVMTERDRYGYAVMSGDPTPQTSPRVHNV